MFTLVGGTFNYFHKGHERLLKSAVDTNNRVIIGLSSDAYVLKHKESMIPFERRKKMVKTFMDKLTDNYEIHPLDTSEGKTLEIDEAVLVVSPETYKMAERINLQRLKLNMKPLEIVKVPFVLAEDLFPVSSTRIIKGEITRMGRRRIPVTISVSTGNELKINGVNRFIKNIMKNYKIIKNNDYETGSEQPFGDDTMRYATDRAMFGLKDYDYSIGIESGIIYNKINNVYYDVHYCSVIDRTGVITTGTSSGFEMPEKTIDGIKNGISTNNFVYREYGIKDAGKKNGIIGIASDNMVTRTDLVYESVRNAFIPRLRPELYGREFI